MKLRPPLPQVGVACAYWRLGGYGHDPTASCACCAENCTTNDAGFDCSGVPVPEYAPDGAHVAGCEVVVDGATIDDLALAFIAEQWHMELV